MSRAAMPLNQVVAIKRKGVYSTFLPHTAFPTSGNLAYWKMGETSGTRIDTVGSFNLSQNGTVGSASRGGSGIQSSGVAAQFSSTNYLLNASLILPPTADFTITGWFNCSNVAAVNSAIASEDLGSNGFVIEVHTSQLIIFTGSGGFIIADSTTLSNNTWYFFFATYTHTNNTFVIGVNAGANSATGISTFTDSGSFLIGAAFGGSISYAGLIDEVGVWSRILTSTELAYLYNSGLGNTHP